MTSRELVQTSRYIAIGSFGIGTLLFLLFMGLHDDGIAVLGLFYVVLAAAVNGYMFLSLLVRAFTAGERHEGILPAVALILGNIPVALLYAHIVLNEIML